MTYRSSIHPLAVPVGGRLPSILQSLGGSGSIGKQRDGASWRACSRFAGQTEASGCQTQSVRLNAKREMSNDGEHAAPRANASVAAFAAAYFVREAVGHRRAGLADAWCWNSVRFFIANRVSEALFFIRNRT